MHTIEAEVINGTGAGKETYSKKRNANADQIMIADQNATASV